MEDIKTLVQRSRRRRRRDAACIIGCCIGLIAVSAVMIALG